MYHVRLTKTALEFLWVPVMMLVALTFAWRQSDPFQPQGNSAYTRKKNVMVWLISNNMNALCRYFNWNRISYATNCLVVFPTEFVRDEQGTRCTKDTKTVLNRFEVSLNMSTDPTSIYAPCETFCSRNEKCRGCSLECNSTCQLSAFTGCVGYHKGAIDLHEPMSLKPGIH